MAERINTEWKGLYKTAGVCALGVAALIILQIFVYIKWPPYTDVPRIFMQFSENKLLGLLGLDFLLLIDNLLLIPVFLALYIVLKKNYESSMLIFTAFGLMGLACYFMSNTSISMMDLSRQYYALEGGPKAAILYAGQAAYAQSSGTAFHISYIVGSLVLIAISIVMLKSKVFSRTTAWFGIASNVLALGLYVPVYGIFISVGSVVLLEVWFVMVGVRLLRIGRQ